VEFSCSQPARLGKWAAALRRGETAAPAPASAGDNNEPHGGAAPLAARVVRDPLFIFFVVGALIFVLFNLRAGDEKVVVLSGEQIDGMVENYRLLRGAEPTPEEIEELKQDYLVNELLFREAIEQGLHLSDAKARELLIEKVKRQVIGEVAVPETADLIEYYSANTDLYRTERSYTFEQVFFLQGPADAQGLAARLNGGEAVAGDAFWQGADFPEYGASMLRGLFSQDFVDRLEAAPLNRWVGPVATTRGWHYVRVSEKLDPRLLPFARVRNQVENDYLASIASEKIEKHMTELESKYDVRIEP